MVIAWPNRIKDAGGIRTQFHHMRVPAMIRWPGKVPGGVVTDQMLAAVDWLPTLAGMAGASNLVPKDRPIDGFAGGDAGGGRSQ
jgi:arylsulfatase A-like enzyme